jgi:hypothetical protein
MIPRHLIIGVAVMLAVVLGIGVFLWRMRGHVVSAPTSVTDARPVAPPPTGPTEAVTLYVAYDDSGTLRAESVRVGLSAGRQQRAEEILRSLINFYLDKSSPHPLAPGSEVRSVYLVEPGLAVIDMNAAFADGHRSGILVEDLTVASLIQSLVANVGGIARVRILIEGKERETLAGHADLTNFYDTAAVSDMVSRLENAP